MKSPKWSIGMQRLCPGVYAKGQDIHFVPEEFCEAMGAPATPENCQVAQEIATQVIRKQFGDVPITLVKDDD